MVPEVSKVVERLLWVHISLCKSYPQSRYPNDVGEK